MVVVRGGFCSSSAGIMGNTCKLAASATARTLGVDVLVKTDGPASLTMAGSLVMLDSVESSVLACIVVELAKFLTDDASKFVTFSGAALT